MSRFHKKRAEMTSLLESFEHSNQTIKDFCIEHGLNYHTFKYWRDKLGKDKSNSEVGGFRQLTAQSSGQLRLVLGKNDPIDLSLPADYPVAALADLIKRLSC